MVLGTAARQLHQHLAGEDEGKSPHQMIAFKSRNFQIQIF
jgi:hypothetical protein